MRVVLTKPVYDLLAIEKSRSPNARMFFFKIYLQAEGGEPSWTVRHDPTNGTEGIKLQSENLELWCSEQDKKELENQVFLKDPKGGFSTVPAIIFHAEKENKRD